MTRLYVGIDFFCPAVYTQNPDADQEDYRLDNGAYYAILQPMLLQWSVPSARDSLSLTAYLNGPGPIEFEPIAGATADWIRNNKPSMATPVPFPPGTLISAAYQLGTATAVALSENAVDDPTGPFALDPTSWGTFARNNFVAVRVPTYESLRTAQKQRFAQWAYGFFVSAKADPARTNLDANIKALFDALNQVPGETAMIPWTAAFRGNDQSGTYAWQVFDRLYSSGTPPARNLASAPKIGAPKFTCEPAQIGSCARSLFSQSAYHSVLWSELKSLAVRNEDKAADSLRRLFGFGERLRWPEQQGSDAFMVLSPHDEFSVNWFITNVHSLLGQVRRLPPPNGSDYAALSFSVNGTALAFNDDPSVPTDFHLGLRALHASVTAAAHTAFNAQLTRDTEVPNGRFTYFPRSAVAAPMPIFWDDGQPRRLTIVPPSLLDALDPFARHEARPATWAGWARTHALPSPCDALPVAEIAVLHAPRLLVKTSELYQGSAYPDLSDTNTHVRLVRLSVAVRGVQLAGALSSAKLYELRIEDRCHASDEDFVAKCVDSLTADPNAAIILRDSAGAFKRVPLDNGRLIAVNSVRRTLVMNGKPAVGEDLTSILDKDVQRLDLLCSAPQLSSGESAFNAFGTLAPTTDVAGPALVLADDFESTYSLSTEGVFERFRLILQPALAAHEFDDLTVADPVRMHFSNFNKLRLVGLKPGTPMPPYRDLVGTQRDDAFLLTYPDALIPLDPNAGHSPVDKAGAIHQEGVYWYKVGHSFTENIPSAATISDDEVRSEMLASEGVHYNLYRDPSQQWELRGTVEHQYGHRVPVVAGQPVQFRYATDVQNPAGLVLRAKPMASTGGQETRIAAIQFFTKGTELSVQLNQEFFKDLSEKAAIDKDSSTIRPGELRSLYESLLDLKNGTAFLSAERWNFSNSPRSDDNALVSGDDVAFPSVVRYLRHEETLTCDIAALRRSLSPLLRPTFVEFATNLATVAAETANPLWSSFVVKRRAIGFDTDTDVVRVAISIVRNDAQVIAATLAPKPPAASAALIEPLRPDQGAAAGDKLLKDYTPLRANAQSDIARYLRADVNQPPYMETPLRESLLWLTARTPMEGTVTPTTNDGIGEPPRERREKMFGSLFQNLDFCPGPRNNIPTPMKFFYVPYAFAPLLAHPALGDPETTTEFAEYLMTILNDIARNGKSDVVQSSDKIDTLLAARDRAREILEQPDGIGALLAKILHRVAVDDPRYANVTAIVEALDQLPTPFEGERLQNRIGATLAANPSLFALAKGIGIVVTDENSFRDELYTLQITKRISNASATAGAVIDRDRFTFRQLNGFCKNRYLLDVLDDVTYDDEFAIDESRFSGQKILARGGTLARTVDDVIEQRNEFDGEEATTTLRTLEADVVHYNPSWKDRFTGEEYYLLPSRRFPEIPTAVLPPLTNAATTAATGSEPDTPWYTRISAFTGAAGPIDISTPKFAQLLRGAMQPEVKLPQGGSWASARRVADSLSVVGDVQAARVDDWYHLESYISMYYFIVTPAEDGFGNDTFTLEAETWPERPPAPEPRHRPVMSTVSPLQQWFVWSRTAHQNAETRPPRPQPVPIDDVVNEIRTWCLRPDDNKVWTQGHELLVARSSRDVVPANTASTTTSVRARYSKGTDGHWRLQIGGRVGVGSVVAADMLELRDKSGAPIQDPQSNAMCVLRFAVLDDPWSYTRARVRIHRNERDFNDDGTSDISPVFEMIEESEWVSYGRHFVRLGKSQLPAGVDRLRADIAGTSDRATWLGASGEVSLGPVVSEMLRRRFATMASPQPFWSDKALAGDVVVQGEVLQLIEDRHARVGMIASQVSIGSTLADVRDQERMFLLKQFVPEIDGTALSGAATTLDKSVVRTADPYLRVTWFSSKDHTPVLQATWPITWS
jgi:peptidoglycan hydrolase-like protein with peptidoglycan-binding domain